MTKELTDKKTERVNEIKDSYNAKSAEVKVEFLSIKKAVIAWSQTTTNVANNPESS